MLSVRLDCRIHLYVCVLPSMWIDSYYSLLNVIRTDWNYNSRVKIMQSINHIRRSIAGWAKIIIAMEWLPAFSTVSCAKTFRTSNPFHLVHRCDEVDRMLSEKMFGGNATNERFLRCFNILGWCACGSSQRMRSRQELHVKFNSMRKLFSTNRIFHK